MRFCYNLIIRNKKQTIARELSTLPGTHMFEQKKYHLLSGLLLAGILLLALFLRGYHIENIPAGLYPDEATNATDAIRAIETGDYKLFYPNNYGREGLFINLQALALQAFGMSVTALKFWSIAFGTLTVLGMYLLGKELFRRRAAGLAAAFMTATAFWTINFSRIGFRAIMMPFLLSFTFFFFFRGLRTRRYLDFVWSGLFLGLGIHTYIAFRLTPLIFVLLLPALMLSYEKFLKRYWKHALVFFFAAFVAAAPMFYHLFVAHPEDFISRSAAISIFEPSINKGDFWGLFGKTFSLSLIKYNFFGDQNWRHNYPPYPILDPLVGTFFLAGFLFVLWQIVHQVIIRFRDQNREIDLVRNTFLLGSFFVMLMPEFLTEEGLPHALRAIGTQIPVFLIAALPVLWILRQIHRSQAGARIALVSLLALFLFGSASINIAKYFVFFAGSPEQHGAFDERYTDMSRYLLSLPAETHKYVVANAGGTQIDNGLPVTAQPIVFLTYGKVRNLEYMRPDTRIDRSHENVIVLQRHDDRLVENVKKKIQDARIESIDPHPGLGERFTAIILPAIIK